MKRTGIKRGTKTLKRSGFKKPDYAIAYEEAKKRMVARKTPPTTRKTPPRLRAKPIKRKLPQKGYKPPKWFNSIKGGSHGNTPAQKKYWRVTTDTYRKEDFEKYGGKCVTCSTILERWQDGQLAHFRAWSVCNGFFKYERKNLALSCAGCNRLSDGVVGNAFAKELQRRHGPDILDWIVEENKKHHGTKMEVWEIVDRTAKLLNIENTKPF